jgi:hypothetical protein
MARGHDGRPKRPRHINLGDDQYQALELISARSLGRPTISSLIREALDDFVRRQSERSPEIAAELQSVRERGDKVVPIRSVKGGQ